MSSKFDYELISSTYTWENCDFTLLILHLNISEVLVYLDSIFVEREPSKFIEMRPRAKYSLFEVEYAILDDWTGNQVVYAKYQSILYAWMLWFMVKPFIYLENDEFLSHCRNFGNSTNSSFSRYIKGLTMNQSIHA